MKTGGIYLQDELLEEEKHERPQRNYFFLGRPWTICSWRESEKQWNWERKYYNQIRYLSVFQSHICFCVFTQLIIKYFSHWCLVSSSSELLKRKYTKQGHLQRHLQFSSAFYWFTGFNLNVCESVKSFTWLYQQPRQSVWHIEPISHFVNREEFLYLQSVKYILYTSHAVSSGGVILRVQPKFIYHSCSIQSLCASQVVSVTT